MDAAYEGTPLELGDAPLTLDDYLQVTHQGRAVRLAPAARVRMESFRASLQRQLEAGRRIYGVNTGYGADSVTTIAPETIRRVQRNTLLSHAAGTGVPIPISHARGMLLLKAVVLVQGYSAVRPIVVDMLLDLLNADIAPLVPEQGSLAASGDLIPSGHMGLAMIGEGEVFYRGERVPAAQALRAAGLEPLAPAEKEGLAIVNGTSFTAAYALENVCAARHLLATADICAAASLQALKGHTGAFDPRVIGVRPFPGALAVAANLRALVAESPLLREKPARVHDPYCLRCVPQVHGASRDAFRYVEEATLLELNAYTDNPLVFPEADEIVSGGNFHAQPVGLPMDMLCILAAELGSISQRRTQHLVAPVYDVGLPQKLSPMPREGLGLFMLNTAASAVVSENKTLCFPASVDSMAVDAVEDHVSMASVAARKAAQVIANTARVLAIELICACQALDLHAPMEPSVPIDRVRALVRKDLPFAPEDRPFADDIAGLAGRILDGTVARAAQVGLGHALL